MKKMEEVVKNKFRYCPIKDVGDFLIIDSSIMDESMINYIIKNNVENLSFNQYDGFSPEKISSFINIPIVKKVEIIMDKIDLNELVGFKNLTYLYLSSSVTKKIELTKFKYLEYLNIEWNNKIKNLNELKLLQELVLRKFKGNTTELVDLKQLKRLSFIQGNLNSLDFIKNLKELKSLSISYLRNPIRIELNKGSKIEELEIDSCKKIRYGNVFLNLLELKKIKISNSSPLPSLRFVKKLHKLSFLSFVETKVEDNDITPCINIEYVGFDNKKSYNCKNINGQAILK